MTYNPVFYEGDVAQEIHSAMLEANRTAERSLLRVEDNIKFARVLTSISGEIEWQEYKASIREADIPGLTAKNTKPLKLGDRKIIPAKMMAFDVITLELLRKTRFSKDMAAGADNIGSTEFEKTATGHLIPRMGKSYEKLIYSSITAESKIAIGNSTTASNSQKAWAAAQTPFLFDGLVASMIMAGVEDSTNAVKSITPTTVTASNIAAEYDKIFQQIDPAELENGTVRIFAPLADYQLIVSANKIRDHKDEFTITGTGKDVVVTFNTLTVEFVPTPARFAGHAGEFGDFVHGTDLLSDTTQFKIDKVNALGDDLFYKMVATSCTTVLDAFRKVLYL